MNKLFLLCRKIHRIFLFLTIPSGAVLIVSGLFLKYPGEVIRYLGFIDLVAVRDLHRNLAPLFAIILLVMMLTGSLMYFFPWLNKKFVDKNARDQNLS
jgi:cytochrome b subunit of formate dehydrogenase